MSKETILILDNEHYIQWTLKTLLEGEGYTVLSSDSILKALHMCTENEVACLITEYWIDHFCTVGVIQELRKRYPEVYIMVLTSKEVTAERYEEILNAGVDDLFKKPFPAKKILLHLKKGLKQRFIAIQKKRLEQELDRIDHQTHMERMFSRERSLPL